MPAPHRGPIRPGTTARARTVLSIQYLRGAAAMAVVLAHIAGHAGLNWSVGAAGVDVFFVISGFIIWTVTCAQPTGHRLRPGRFMIDRLTRIAPPYILLTFAIYLAATRIPAAFPNMQTSLRHVMLSALFIPHTDPYGTQFPQIIPGWTLNYEVFFYFLFALALGLAPRRRLLALTAALGTLTGLGLVLHEGGAVAATYTSPLLLEFAGGLWLGAAWQHRRLPSAIWGYAAIAAGLGALIAWQGLNGREPAHGMRVLVWGGPALLIVLGALAIELHRGVRLIRKLAILGDASYSIYLVNVFAVAATWRVLAAFPVPVYCATAILVTVLVGLAFWRGVERPLTSLARHLAHRPAPHTTPVALMHATVPERS